MLTRTAPAAFQAAAISWLPIEPNRMYPFGGSSSPENVYVTRVTEDAVYYAQYPYTGPGVRCGKSSFHALTKTGVGYKIGQLEGMINHPIFGSADWVAPQLQHLKNLLNGANTLPVIDQTDFDPMLVVAKQHPAHVPAHDRDDLYYIMEQYGSTGLRDAENGKPELAYTRTTRGELRELMQQKAIMLVSVKEGLQFED